MNTGLIKAKHFYSFLLHVYPSEFNDAYEEALLLLFEDVYKEQEQHGITFWSKIIYDTFLASIEQYFYIIQKNIMAQTSAGSIPINTYNVVGGIFLLPSLLILLLDLISSIAQGNLSHPNEAVFSFLNHTFLYTRPILFTWIIVFPLLAVIVNAFPLIDKLISKKENVLHVIFSKQSMVSIACILFGLGFLIIVKFHDFAPCMVHGILNHGLTNISQLYTTCNKA